MSASTVSITANQGPTARRRTFDKNASSADVAAAATAVTLNDNNNDSNRITAADTAAAILRDAKKTPVQSHSKKSSSPAKKPPKPRWLTVVSILTKNIALLVVLMGFVQMIRWVVMNSGREAGDFSVVSGDFEGKLSEVERFVKTTVKAMQVQVNAIDHKIDSGIGTVRKELHERVEKLSDETNLKLKAVDVRNDVYEKFMDEFRSKSLLTKEEFVAFFEDFQKAIAGNDGREEVSMDEIKEFARKIVEKEIEKHAADGLGMADYALATGGGRVLRHSEPYGGRKLGIMWPRNAVSPDAEKLIKPSFGEPGQCFPLKGETGFVEIKLRTAIVPEAVTLEHVAKSVAYDRSSAPKDCRVSGWLEGPEATGAENNNKQMFLLTEFTYDLEKSNAQTFKVNSAAPNLVDTIRLDFSSNQGSASHTCIYRLRVHGREPNSMLVTKS